MSHERYPTQPNHETIERVFGDISEIGELAIEKGLSISSDERTGIRSYGAHFVVDETTFEHALVQVYEDDGSQTRAVTLTRQNTPREIEITGNYVWRGNHWRPNMDQEQTATMDMHEGGFKYLSVKGRDGRWERTHPEHGADDDERKEIVDFAHRALLRARAVGSLKGKLA